MNKVEMNRCFAGARKPLAAGRGAVALLLLFPALSAAALTDTATGLVYEENNGEVAVTGYGGPGGHVVIPALLGGHPVTTIRGGSGMGIGAFNNNDTITLITVPDSVQSIGDQAIRDCDALAEVEIGDGVQSIGHYAFSGCDVLASITIPDNVQSIGYQAFSDCAGLKTVYFEGDAPKTAGLLFFNTPATVYRWLETSGWKSFFADRPVKIGRSVPYIFGAGMRDGGRFGFEVQWTAGREVVVEVSDNLTGGVWTPVSTNTLPDTGSMSFEKAVPENRSIRCYRVRSG